MADGAFIINDRRATRDSPAAPLGRPFGLSLSAAPVVCTPSDPFGRGKQGATWQGPSAWSKTEEEMRIAQERSAAQLGEAMLGPVLKAAEWSPPGRAFEFGLELIDIAQGLYESGASGLAGKALTDLAIREAGRALEKKLNLPKGTGGLIGSGLKDAIKMGSGGAPEPGRPQPLFAPPMPPPPTANPKPHNDDNDSRDEPRWYRPHREPKEQDQIQQGVDRHEKRQREDPGTMIA